MLKKFTLHTPKSFSNPKKKSVSLKSLNLYSNDSEKKNENKNLNNNNYNKKIMRNYFHIIKNINWKPIFSKSKLKEKYFKIIKKNLSPNSLFLKEKSRNKSSSSAIIRNNSIKDKKILREVKDNKYLYNLKVKSNNSNKIKKSNSCLNIINFSTINSTLNLYSNKLSILSSKRKNCYSNKKRNKSKEKANINSYNNKDSKAINFSKIWKYIPTSEKKSLKNKIYEQRKKYPFIYNSQILHPKKFENLPESIINENKKLYSNLINENLRLFAQSFNIINKGRFSKKYENPWDYQVKYHIINKKESEDEKQIIFGKQLIKDLAKMIELNKKSKKPKNIIFGKFRKKLREILIIFKNLIIPLSEIINTYKISNHIFGYEKTKELIFAIKANNFDMAFKTLTHYKYIVLDIDQFYQTPLHFAAKYNFYKLIPLIIGYGGYVDAKNSYGETPLIISVKRNYYESILLLFLYFASPFIIFKDNKKLIDINKDFKTNFICEKIKDIYIRNMLIKSNSYYNIIKNEITNFIVNECQVYIKNDCLEYIQNKINFYKFED